jgi:hypothetical protein
MLSTQPLSIDSFFLTRNRSQELRLGITVETTENREGRAKLGKPRYARSALGPCHNGRARAWAVTNGRPRSRGTAGRSPFRLAAWMMQTRHQIVVPKVSGAWTLADEGNTILRMITVQYKTRRNGEHVFWVGRHGSHSVRIDANQPGVYRWTITRDRQSVASGVAADRDQAANDAAAALAELSR